MRIVFADTSYWVAIINPRDGFHRQAGQSATLLGADFRIVTSEMVLAEVLNLLAGSRSHIRNAAVKVVQRLILNTRVELVSQTSELFRQAFALYRDRPDKDWSLTDCASFVIMDERHIIEALTHDRHFEQKGYRALLRG